MLTLPESYQKEMQQLLGDEYPSYLNSLNEPPVSAFRINTLKVTGEVFDKINPFSGAKVAWNDKAYCYDESKERPARHPYYYAGLYYIQEPSAMIPASLLPVEAGDRVLDLCAAPGGKATELGAKLRGTGLLVANDISVSRTKPLIKNLQLAGIPNAVVTAEAPERLSHYFPAFFDKILVDAPCSGEGMFRREPRMLSDWLLKGTEHYAVMQREILRQAYAMLAPGGKMVYSTCTFSLKENEENIQWFLEEYPDMQVCPVKRASGYSAGKPEQVKGASDSLKECVRLFPHLAKGEGHFAVLLQKARKETTKEPAKTPFSGDRKSGKDSGEYLFKAVKDSAEKQQLSDFLSCFSLSRKQVFYQNGELFFDPVPEYSLKGLRVVLRGVKLAEWKHKLLPTPQSALLVHQKHPRTLNLSVGDERVIRYLKGETIVDETAYSSNVLICVDGFSLGWCRGMGNGSLKNKYHPGWRYQ